VIDSLPPLRLVAALMHLVPALVWLTIAVEFWRVRRGTRTQSTLFLLMLLISSFFAVHLLLHVVIELTPGPPGAPPSALHNAIETIIGVLTIAMGPMMLHAVRHMPLRAERPSRLWLTVVYGSGVLIAGTALVAGWSPAGFGSSGWFEFGPLGHRPLNLFVNQLSIPYVLVTMAVALARAWQFARVGAWQQGPGVVELRSPDIVVLSATLALGGAMMLWLVASGMASFTSMGSLFLHTAVALGFAVPLAVRMLGRVVHGFLLSMTLLLAAAGVYFGFSTLAQRAADPNVAMLWNLAGIAALIGVLVPGRALLRDLVDGLVFRRGRVRRAQLLEIVSHLSPELGIAACCRLALAEASRIMQLQSAAIVLTGGRGSFTHGPFDLAALERRWPADAAAGTASSRPMMEIMLRELPPSMADALLAANVSRLAAIVSPRQHWGHLFATEGLLAAPFNDADIDALAAFLGQLALLLDAAELRDRAIAVERSLAHAEKLAAIGELTARIAHEIRNPVTAARSLAQQLAREGGAAREEHELILSALDRVERQVAELLRFARRDELRRAATDVGELVRSTVAGLRSRLEQADVNVVIDAPAQVLGMVDGEKLRQVLVNLLENARDALCEWRGERVLAIAVASSNGSVTLRVRDSGPGVAPDVLDKLFDPFFTSKPDGTGLGLAIVKRIVDAHGGEVRARTAPGGGLCFEIDLPVDSPVPANA
jgi:signal transduction histidine kinase